MRTTFFGLVAFGFVFLSLPLSRATEEPAQEDKDYYITSTNGRGPSGSDKELHFDFSISSERLAAQPDWSPTFTSIPLQPQQAAQAALAWYRAKYPSVDSLVSVTHLSLSTISLTGSRKWHYSVIFSVPSDARKTLPEEAVSVAVVLLDGTVVEPHSVPPHQNLSLQYRSKP
jgi:hypothetical protein